MVPLRGNRGTPIVPSVTPPLLPELSSKLIATLVLLLERLFLKRGKNPKKFQRLLQPPPLPGAELHPSAHSPMAESRTAGTHPACTNDSPGDLVHPLWASFPSLVK